MQGETESIIALWLRLDRNRDLLSRYEAIHHRMIATVASSDDAEAYERDRLEFENTYHRVLDAMQNRIDNSQASATSSNVIPTSHARVITHLRNSNFTVAERNGAAFATASSPW